VVEAEIDLPFDAEIAFDAYSDLPRQPTWSPWLKSVEFLDDGHRESEWKMRYAGLRLSWIAVSTNNRRPYVIEWESTKGFRNRGRVDFVKLADQRRDDKDRNTDAVPSAAMLTHMKVTMTFQVPGLVAKMFPSHGRICHMVENRMLKPTLEKFRDIVLEKDVPEHAQRPKQTATASREP